MGSHRRWGALCKVGALGSGASSVRQTAIIRQQTHKIVACSRGCIMFQRMTPTFFFQCGTFSSHAFRVVWCFEKKKYCRVTELILIKRYQVILWVPRSTFFKIRSSMQITIIPQILYPVTFLFGNNVAALCNAKIEVLFWVKLRQPEVDGSKYTS